LAYVERMLVLRLWSLVSALRVIQIVISELNTLTPLLNMASKVGINQKVLLVADKLDIETDIHLHVTLMKLVEELGAPVLT
jgi:hypothetical protein